MPNPSSIILTHYEATALQKAHKEGKETETVSLDLRLTESSVGIEATGIILPDGQRLSWETIARIKKNDAASYLVQDNTAEKIQFFSPAQNRFYSLRPTDGAPTMLVAGFPMHRIKDVDPHQDTLHKIQTLSPISGRVLDTTTGLGYTAIEAAKTADYVTTIELDPTALEIARRNPWSRGLFDNPKIEQIIGDSVEVVQTLPDKTFDFILHDPPTLALGGDLYSGAFYKQLYRALKPGGRLYHYVGDLESRQGSSVAKGAVKRLHEAGFSKVVKHLVSFGIVCTK